MADKDREAEEAKRRAEEDEEDEALAGETGSGHDDDADEEHEPAVRSGAVKEVADAKIGARVEREGRAAATARASSRLAQRRQPPKGSLAQSLMLFVIIVGGLIVAFAFIGREEPNQGPAQPKWAVGQTVDVEITVVPSDAKDLACASIEDVKGKKCQFEAPGKAFAPVETDDKKVLKPYTTTDRVQFMGAGLWAEPALAPAKLPNTRFSVKCKFAVETKVRNPGIRWAADGNWFTQTEGWNAGTLSNCVVTPP